MQTRIPFGNWMWIKDWTDEDDLKPQVVYFRKEITVREIPLHCAIGISADSRYKLYVNGAFVQEGPAKGDREIWFVDEADLSAYMKEGENVVAVEVLRYPEKLEIRNHSLYRTASPCLYIEDRNTELSLQSSEGWMCCRNQGITFLTEPFQPAPLHILEEAVGSRRFNGWKEPDFITGGNHILGEEWTEAVSYGGINLARRIGESPFNLVERMIPPQRHEDKKFKTTVCVREGTKHTEDWNHFWDSEGALTIAPHSREIVEIDAGELMTGYLILRTSRGTGSRIEIHCAECYSYEGGKKGDRTDWVNGSLNGCSDIYHCGGTEEGDTEIWESYWFRTFRFIRLTIDTADEPLILKSFAYRETGYPLDVKTKVTCSDESLKKIWEISERTLRRCMHETYFDCPFYEQLQYVMDTRMEALATYVISGDDRLARKAMDDFRRSQRSDGILNSCAPSVRTNVIPGFSIYYILMVHDHMMYFGDRELVRDHFPAIDAILNFFGKNLTEEGLVGKVGGPHFRARYWSFIDWTAQWNSTSGVPTACLKGSGSITMESLLYMLGLMKAAELADDIGRTSQAEEYRQRAGLIGEAILKNCKGQVTDSVGEEIRLIQDGPGIDEYSVHCQAFAILCGLVSAEEGRRMLTTAMEDRTRFAQCSVAMQFYLFRALEAVDAYEATDRQWDLWRQMVRNHMTTCVENDTDARSDCHAWASLILYELPAVSLGIRPAAPGFRKAIIRPVPGYMTQCEGDVITPLGAIHAEWERSESGELHLTWNAPSEMEVEV